MLIERLQRVALAGGSAWVLYLLVVLSVLAVGMTIERWVFFRKHKDDTDGMADAIVEHLRKGDRRGADKVLEASPSIEALVVRPALSWLDGGPEAVQEILDCEMGKQRRELERSMTFLGTLGNNAPFVGLLGTVLGVIRSFQQLGEGQNKQAMGNVMSGIAEALIATGVGLIVAIPAVVAYNVFQKKAGEIEANVGIMAKKLLAYLKSRAHLAHELQALGEQEANRLSDSIHGTPEAPGVAATVPAATASSKGGAQFSSDLS